MAFLRTRRRQVLLVVAVAATLVFAHRSGWLASRDFSSGNSELSASGTSPQENRRSSLQGAERFQQPFGSYAQFLVPPPPSSQPTDQEHAWLQDWDAIQARVYEMAGASNAQHSGRILLVTGGFLGCNRMGGISSAFTRLAFTLRDTGYTVHVLYTDIAYCLGEKMGEQVEFMRTQGINFIPLPQSPVKVSGYPQMSLSFRVSNWLHDNQDRFDIAIAHDYAGLDFPHLQFVLSCHANTRLSNTFNGRVPLELDGLLTYYMEQETYRLSTALVSPSQWYLGWLRSVGYEIPPLSLVLQNTMHPPRPLPSPHRTIAVDLAFFGRLEILKGFLVFMDALEKFFKSMEARGAFKGGRILNVYFIGVSRPVGKKSASKTVRDRCKPYAFAKCHVRDKYNSTEAIDHLRVSRSLAVIPTLADVSPYTVLESMYYEIPFIASRVGGIPELIDERFHDSILFPPGDADVLAAVMERAMVEGITTVTPRRSFFGTSMAWAELLRVLKPPGDGGTSLSLPKVPEYTGAHVQIVLIASGDLTVFREHLSELAHQEHQNFHLDVLVFDRSQEQQPGRPATSLRDELTQIASSILGSQRSRIHTLSSMSNLRDGILSQLQATDQNAGNDNFVLVLEDQDLPEPNMLQALVQASMARSLDIATFFWEKCKVKGDAWDCHQVNLGLGNSLSVGVVEGVTDRPSSVFGRTSVVRALVAKAPTSWPGEETYSLHLEAALSGFRMELVPMPLLHVRAHGEADRTYHEKYLRTAHSVWQGFFGRLDPNVSRQLWHMQFFAHLVDISKDGMDVSSED